MSRAAETTELAHCGGTLEVPDGHLAGSCRLFRENRSLLGTRYDVKADVSLETLRLFTEKLEDASAIDLDARSAPDLLALAREFGHKQLKTRILDFLEKARSDEVSRLSGQFEAFQKEFRALLDAGFGASISALQARVGEMNDKIEDLGCKIANMGSAREETDGRFEERQQELLQTVGKLKDEMTGRIQITSDGLSHLENKQSLRLEEVARDVDTAIDQKCRAAEEGQLRRLAELSGEIRRIDAKVAEFSGIFVRIKAKVAEFSKAFVQVNSKFTELSGELDRIDAKVAEFPEERNRINAKVAQFPGELIQINAKFAEFSKSFIRINSKVMELSGEVGRVNAKLAVFPGEISRVDAKVAGFPEDLDRIDAKIAEFSEEFNRINAIVIGMATVQDDISSIREDTAAAQASSETVIQQMFAETNGRRLSLQLKSLWGTMALLFCFVLSRT
jgi:predicted nuclease with TOPRIM domain